MMNSFMENIQREELPITYEVPSPRGSQVDDYIDDIKNFDFLDSVHGLNVCNNPVGTVHIDPAPYAGRILNEINVPPIAHLTCRDSTLSGLQRWLLGAHSLGIKSLLAMTGDIAVGDYPTEEKVDHINSLELITGIKDYLNKGELMPELSATQSRMRNRYLSKKEEIENPLDFTVGGVILPGRAREPEYTAKKIEAGADFFQTQITYDSSDILEFLEELEDMTERHPPVLVGTSPFSTPEEMNFLSDTVPQVDIPDEIQKRLSRADDFGQESVRVSVEMYEKVKDGAQEKGLNTKVGAHIIPIRSKERAGDIVRKVSQL